MNWRVSGERKRSQASHSLPHHHHPIIYAGHVRGAYSLFWGLGAIFLIASTMLCVLFTLIMK